MRFFQSFLLSYSGFAILGMLAMGLMSWFLCRKTGVSPMKLLPLLVLGLVPLYLGAKLFGILSLCVYRSNIGRPVDWTVVKNSGIVFYGGLIGYLLFFKWAFPPYMQKQTSVSRGILAVCIPLFHGFARIGCYFGRCCYGMVLEAAWCAPFFEHRLPPSFWRRPSISFYVPSCFFFSLKRKSSAAAFLGCICGPMPPSAFSLSFSVTTPFGAS